VLDSTFAGIDDMCHEDLATTGQALAALLREYLGKRTSLPEAGLIGRARGKAMRDYVERHLLDDALGADVLADRFAASRATVYRAFAEQDGLSRYIWARRIDRAYHDLAHSPPHRGAIAAVAERYRFSTASHFNRAFRQAHGVRPSDVLGLAVGAGTDLTVDSRETFDRDALEQVRNLYALIAGSDRARS
jgi:AraC-like DNA-binding protein